MDSEDVNLGCGCLSLMFMAAWWITIALVALHFIRKYW